MFFFTKDVEESPAFLFVVTAVILMTNLVYMMYWSVSLWRALREEVPVLMRCHTRCALECIQCRESLSDACSRVCLRGGCVPGFVVSKKERVMLINQRMLSG